MSDSVNLDVSFDQVPLSDDTDTREKVARVCVASAHGFSRDGGAPIVTIDCGDFRTFDAEVRRLKDELDAASERVRSEWNVSDGAKEPADSPTQPPRRPKGREAISVLKVRDVMTPDPRTLHRNDPIAVADELMKVGRFRHVVVLDESDHVAGVVSHRDLVYGALSWSFGLGKASYEHALNSTPVKAVMQSRVKVVNPEAPLGEAAELMMEHKIGCLPVVDGPRLVGIVTEGDFLALLGRSL